MSASAGWLPPPLEALRLRALDDPGAGLLYQLLFFVALPVFAAFGVAALARTLVARVRSSREV